MARTSSEQDGPGPMPAGRWPGWALAGVSGLALYAVSRHGPNLWWLSGVALVPMVVAQYRLLTRRQAPVAVGIAALGFWVGVAQMGSGLWPTWAWMAVAVPFAIGVGLLALLDRPYAERTGYRWFLVQMPVLWVGLDVLFALNPALAAESWWAYDFAWVPWLIQPVSVVGTPALTFVVLVCNYAVALLVLLAMDRNRTWAGSVPVPRTRGLRQALAGAVLVVVWVAGSLLLLHQVRQSWGPMVTVAAVQPGVDPDPVVVAPVDGPSDLRQRLEAGTAQAADRGAALVVWPELIVGGDVASRPTSWVSAAARDAGAWLVTGVAGPNGEDPPNTAVVVDPTGQVAGSYGKQHPVIMENEFFSQPVGDQVFHTDWGTFGVTICFDNQYVDSPREAVEQGARLIATPVLVWSTMGPGQNAEIVFRAVEERVAYVRSEWQFSSAVIAPDGTLVTVGPQGGQATVVADVPLGTGPTPFTSWGWLVPWVFVVMLGLRLVDQVRTSPRRPGRSRSQGSAGRVPDDAAARDLDE